MQKVEELSGGQVRMAAGTLYGAIENLVKLKFIQPVASEDSRRKVYAITSEGLEILRLTRKTMFGYEFEPTKPDHAKIKVDYRTFKKQEDFEDYCALFEDSGWEHIAGTKSSG